MTDKDNNEINNSSAESITEDYIEVVLKSIGLNKNETRIYLDLIKYGISSALEIASRTKIYRSNTYDALNKLIEKGFVKEVVEEKRKMFRCLEPEKIKDYLNQKQQEVDKIIPRLSEYSGKPPEGEIISISKGVFALRSSLNTLLEMGEPINVYGIPRDSYDVVGEGFAKYFHDERIKRKIVMRQIYSAEAIDRIKRLNAMPYTEARHLARKYDTDVSTNICGNTVFLFLLSDPVSIIEIRNKQIADTFTKHFEALWHAARK